MTAVRAAFERLMAAHRDVGSPLPQCLRPPIEPARLAQVEQRLGARVPPGVVQWYECADGVDVLRWDDVAVVPPRLAGGSGPEFVPLEEACATAEEFAAVDAEEPPGTVPPGMQAGWEEGWRLAWPIWGGECVAVDCVTAPGTLWVVRWEAGDIWPLEWDTAGFLHAAADYLVGSFQWSPDDGWFMETAEGGDELPEWPEVQGGSLMSRSPPST